MSWFRERITDAQVDQTGAVPQITAMFATYLIWLHPIWPPIQDITSLIPSVAVPTLTKVEVTPASKSTPTHTLDSLIPSVSVGTAVE